MLEVRGRKVTLIEQGRGEPLVYLHGFADVHGVAGEFQPFHLRLGTSERTLTDEEVDARMERAQASLRERLGAEIRA